MKKALTIGLLIVAAIPFLIAVAALPEYGSDDAPVHTHVSARYIEHGAEEAGATNIVTGVLLNYRSLDTAGEVTVIFTALASVLAVLIVRGVVGSEHPRQTEQPPADPTVPAVSPVTLFVVKLLAPFVGLFAIYIMLKGHVTPGGGFQGGAILGALFIALTVVLGSERTRMLARPAAMVWLQGAAVISFIAIGTLGAALSSTFLGYPESHLVTELMMIALEIGIGIGGAAVFAAIFLQMEVER